MPVFMSLVFVWAGAVYTQHITSPPPLSVCFVPSSSLLLVEGEGAGSAALGRATSVPGSSLEPSPVPLRSFSYDTIRRVAQAVIGEEPWARDPKISGLSLSNKYVRVPHFATVLTLTNHCRCCSGPPHLCPLRLHRHRLSDFVVVPCCAG
jgi:hypothetical protein